MFTEDKKSEYSVCYTMSFAALTLCFVFWTRGVVRIGKGLVSDPKFKHRNYDRFSLGQTKNAGIVAVTTPCKFQP